MNSFTWTEIQSKRLKELGADRKDREARFHSPEERDPVYQKLEKQLVKKYRLRLEDLRSRRFRPGICELESRLIKAMVEQEFVQVSTPIIMSKGLLAKMSIDESHALSSQVFWLDKTKCLRPMLAPHLYYILKDLLRLWERPVRIFEVGPCFRKESQGAKHANEFTMLNLVEMGLPEDQRDSRLKELAAVVMNTAGIERYLFESEKSEVYGETLDVVVGEDNLEVGSGAMGPHVLDNAWKITDTWVGIGFGLERLLMVAEGSHNLGSVGRSISYLDGVRLNI